jgi:hypothetical protein
MTDATTTTTTSTAAANCGGDVPYNAGPATDRDGGNGGNAASASPSPSSLLLVGAARPGAIKQRCFDLSAPKVTAAEVDAWADEMINKHGAQRVVGLLTASELATYEPGALEQLGERFSGDGRWRNVLGVKEGDAAALREVLDLIDAGVQAGERVVVHCWGGGGRTGNALAGWLAARGEKVEAAEAARRVCDYAARHGLKRRADAAGVQQYVDAYRQVEGGRGGQQ